MKKFWLLSYNKVKFQRFDKSCLFHLVKRVNRPFIVSGTLDGQYSNLAQHLNSAMGIDEIFEFQLPFEEADMRLIPHIQWNVIDFLRSSVTVIPDYTDALVLLLFYFKGLRELYQKGRGNDKKMLPIRPPSQQFPKIGGFGGYLLILQALWSLLRGHFGVFGGFSKTNTLLRFQFGVQNCPVFLLI